MALNFEIQENKIFLFGDTFSLKETIKQIGGRWNSQEKKWWLQFNEQNIESIKNLGFSGNSIEVMTTTTKVTEIDVEKSYYKISEFVQIINSVIRTHLNQQYWIYGEISSLKIANGHVFFDLIEKDESLLSAESSFKAVKAASLSCILWAGKKKSLQEKINDIPFADGTQIKVKVGVDFRKEGARIVAVVEDIDSEHTKGNLLLQRHAIVQELKKRNLYFKNKSTRLNIFPIRIALITAENSRACSDFLDELKMSKVSFQITIFDCNMQGEKTSENLVSAFTSIHNNIAQPFECVVITRGGGSKLDLRWFDDLEIAKQIAYCNLPVITAVGHFDDISIADEISYQSEKTPTAAARFLTSKINDAFTELFSRVDNISRILLKKFEKERQKLQLIEQKITFYAKRKFQNEQKNLDQIEQFLKIFSSSIEKTMQRGFSLVYDSEGNMVTGKNFLSENFPKSLQLQFIIESLDEKQTVCVDVETKKIQLK